MKTGEKKEVKCSSILAVQCPSDGNNSPKNITLDTSSVPTILHFFLTLDEAQLAVNNHRLDLGMEDQLRILWLLRKRILIFYFSPHDTNLLLINEIKSFIL